jgi:hypothetical protein
MNDGEITMQSSVPVQAKISPRRWKEKLYRILDGVIGPVFCMTAAFLYARYSASLDGGFLFALIGFVSFLITVFFGLASFYITIPLQIIIGISQVMFDFVPVVEQLVFSTSFMIGLSVTYLGIGSYKKTKVKMQAVQRQKEQEHPLQKLYQEQLHRADELSKQLHQTLVEMMKKEEESSRHLLRIQTLEQDLDVAKNETIQAILHECEQVSRAEQEIQDTLIENTVEALQHEPVLPFEAKYLQLRSQFEEKSRILRDTRKELFQANERAELLQRKLDELAVQAPTEQETRLMQELQKLEASKAAMQKNYEQVLISYEQLIQQILTTK